MNTYEVHFHTGLPVQIKAEGFNYNQPLDEFTFIAEGKIVGWTKNAKAVVLISQPVAKSKKGVN